MTYDSNGRKKDVNRIFELLKDILEYHKSMYPTRFQNISKYDVYEIKLLIEDRKIWDMKYQIRSRVM